MPDEILTPEDQIETNPNELEIETRVVSDPEEDTPKKRITRRRLRPKKKIEVEERTPEIDRTERREISEVLDNLYGEQPEDDVQEIKKVEGSGFWKATVFILIAAFFALVLWAGFFLVPNKSGDQSQIVLAINGPTELNIGALTTYSISYANNSAVPINNVVLNTYYPDGFVFSASSPSSSNEGHNEWELGTLKPYQKGMISVSGYNFGGLNTSGSWRVFLNYRPENFNSELQKLTTMTSTITRSPFKLTISGPDQVTVGGDARYSYFLQRTGDWSGAVTVVPDIPSNFTIVSSSPNLTKNQWLVKSASSSQLIFTLNGKYTSSPDKPAPMKGRVLYSTNNQNYEIASAQLTSEILKNEIGVNLGINGNSTDFGSFPGDILNITLRAKNSSQTEIKNATLRLVILAPAKDRQNNSLDWAGFVDKFNGNMVGEQMDNGMRQATVSWTSAQIPALSKLKPNDEIVVDLKLPVKDAKAFASAAGNNYSMNAEGGISFKDATKTTQTVSTKPITINMNSDLTFDNKDDKIGSGIGETHDVNWTLKNTVHPLKNITVTATTYGDLSFDVRDKAAGELTYSNNTITWTIPEMPEETDVLNSRFTLTLNKYNPTQTLLLSKVTVTADDAVTGKTITLSGDEIPFKAE